MADVGLVSVVKTVPLGELKRHRSYDIRTVDNSAVYEGTIAQTASPLGLHPRTVTWVLDAVASGYDNSSYCEGIGPAPPCARYPLDDLLGQDLKTINLSAYGAAGGSSRACPT